MENFIAYNPTVLHFGKGVTSDLSKAINFYGRNVLLIYGKTSIKKNGIYKKIKEQLELSNAKVFEFNGIKSNPIAEDVDAAAAIGRKNEINCILAVGGGSVIDSAKIISITIPVKNNAWDFYAGKISPKKAIPVLAVLTLAATGTETNCFAVIQNNSTKQKSGYGHELLHTKHSYLDPEFTYTVPKNYTAYGIVDLISHCLEAYFGKGDASLSDRFIVSIIKEAMEYGPLLLNNLNNYDLRARIMYAASSALNGLTTYGKRSGDWGAHSISHVISLLYDVPHGAALSITYPAWFDIIKTKTSRVKQLGHELFGYNDADDTIDAIEEFFKSLDSPVRLADLNINQSKVILDTLIQNKAGGTNFKLSSEELQKIVHLML